MTSAAQQSSDRHAVTFQHKLPALFLGTVLSATVLGNVSWATTYPAAHTTPPHTLSFAPPSTLLPLQKSGLTDPVSDMLSPAFSESSANTPTAIPTGSTAPPLPIPALHFEPNLGQSDKAVRYMATTPGYSAFLTNKGLVLQLARAAKGQTPPATLTLSSVGSALNPSATIEHEQPLSSTSNYYRGNDPDKWQHNVPHVGRVVYRDIYPDIDLAFYGKGQQLEYDYIVKPGADPSVIAVALSGVSDLQLQDNGDLALTLSTGETLTQQAPIIYQNGPDGREIVSGHYVLASAGERSEPLAELPSGQIPNVVRFSIGKYDQSRELLIDPVLEYSTFLGGSNFEVGFDLAVAADGSIYVTGTTASANFPTSTGSVDSDGNDAFLSRFAVDGSLLWSVLIGGSNTDTSFGISLDSGTAWITGTTFSNDFPQRFPSQSTFGGITDAFVARFYNDGSLAFSTFLGGSAGDNGKAISVDGANAAWVTGYTSSLDFPTVQASQPTRAGSSDAFVTHIDSLGNLASSTYLGGGSSDSGHGIAVDDDGAVWVAGDTFSSDFPTVLPYQATNAGNADAFITKFSQSGARIYSTYLGGSVSESGSDIAVRNGAIWITGTTRSINFPLLSPTQSTPGGGSDIFITHFDDAGAMEFSTFLGGSGDDYGYSIGIDNNGAAWTTGSTRSALDFPLLSASQETYGGGIKDAFISKVDATGSLGFSTFLGGSGTDYGNAIAIGNNDTPWLTGRTTSNDFPTHLAFQESYGGGSDAFLTAQAPLVPPASIPLFPFGATINMPTFKWTRVADASWYYLWVDGPAGNEFKTWYRAASVGCDDGPGPCTMTPTTTLTPGAHTWWVLTYNDNGYGPWSAPRKFSVAGDNNPPLATALLTPTGSIATASPTYTWNAVSNSTWYFLWVNDANGNAIKTWYTAAQSDCASGTGTCSITPATAVSGNSVWWVQTWNTNGSGPWSNILSFVAP